MQLPRLLVLALLAVPATVAETGLCRGRDFDPTVPLSDYLRGAHLRVLELEWPPYATKDPTAPHGWRGFDIDLFDAVATTLGFTFEIAETPLLDGESYTDMLLRTVGQTDMWLSWWLRSRERMNGAAMLFGHVDSSPVLVAAPPKGAREPDLFQKMEYFFRPFSVCPLASIHRPRATSYLLGDTLPHLLPSALALTQSSMDRASPPQWGLWGCLFAMIVISGLIDFFLEYGHGGTLPSSIHEYFGGVLWGGFQDPHTRLSAVFQVGSPRAICHGFLVLILSLSLTLTLAPTLTLALTLTLAPTLTLPSPSPSPNPLHIHRS